MRNQKKHLQREAENSQREVINFIVSLDEKSEVQLVQLTGCKKCGGKLRGHAQKRV